MNKLPKFNWADEIYEEFEMSKEFEDKHIKKKIWKLLLELIDGTITKELFLEKKKQLLKV